MREKPRISILYLGKRGGGAQFALQAAQELALSPNLNFQKLIIRRDNETCALFDESKRLFLFKGGPSFRSFIKCLIYLARPTLLMNQVHLNKGDVCLVPMLSPLGIWIEKLLHQKGVLVIRVIHDANKHPGDIWPLNSTINKVVESSKVIITLSDTVTKKIRAVFPEVKIITSRHPVFSFIEGKDELELPSRYVLFVGRIRKYKGLNVLEEAFDNLQDPSLTLVIAGEGKLKLRNQNGKLIINRWLTEKEISELILRSEVVAFPYIESSQSGLIPYCKSKNKKVVITPTSGLKEQTQDYVNSFVSDGYTSHDLSEALQRAIHTPTKFSNGKLGRLSNLSTDVLEAICYLE